MAAQDDKDKLAAAQAAEYSTYVATGNIYHNGALAYTAGHAVPVSNVKAYKYDQSDQVKKVTKAAANPPAEVIAANEKK